MNSAPPLTIAILYDPIRLSGRFERRGEVESSAWDRLAARVIGDHSEATVTEDAIELPWAKALGLLRDFGNRTQQHALNFRFSPEGEAISRIKLSQKRCVLQELRKIVWFYQLVGMRL